eukprot:13394290-Heterocapsa_arctica.AAC.1
MRRVPWGRPRRPRIVTYKRLRVARRCLPPEQDLAKVVVPIQTSAHGTSFPVTNHGPSLVQRGGGNAFGPSRLRLFLLRACLRLLLRLCGRWGQGRGCCLERRLGAC